MSNLLLLKHILLAHFLHGDHLAGLSESANANFTEGSSANYTKEVKILHGNLLTTIMNNLKCFKYSLLLISASLCRMSCLISSYSASLKFNMFIFSVSLSHAIFKSSWMGVTLTLLSLAFLIIHLAVFAFYVGFRLLSLFLGGLSQYYRLLRESWRRVLRVSAPLRVLCDTPTLGLAIRSNVVSCHVSTS